MYNVYNYIHVLMSILNEMMRRKEERSKQGQTNHKAKKQHIQGRHFS